MYRKYANMKELPIRLPIPMQLTGNKIVKKTALEGTSEKLKFGRF